MTTTPRPIPIPRDLKPGAATGVPMFYLQSGREEFGDTPPIIRIERIASKPRKAKVDKDAKWLLEMAAEGRHKLKPSAIKRLRAIARRLNGGGK